MMVLDRDPTESVYFAPASLIILSFLNPNNRLTVKKALAALEDASKSMIDITPICGMAGIIVGSITLTGLGMDARESPGQDDEEKPCLHSLS